MKAAYRFGGSMTTGGSMERKVSLPVSFASGWLLWPTASLTFHHSPGAVMRRALAGRRGWAPAEDSVRRPSPTRSRDALLHVLAVRFTAVQHVERG